MTDKATQRKLNVINVSLFTPALLFSKVSQAVSRATAADMAGGVLVDAGQTEGDVDHSAWICTHHWSIGIGRLDHG